MPDAPTRKPISARWLVLWLTTLAITIAIYWPGLAGDFLFDDNPRSVRNELIHNFFSLRTSGKVRQGDKHWKAGPIAQMMRAN